MWGNEDVEFMDTSDTPWCWYYLADCGSEAPIFWEKFDPTSPYQLIPVSELTSEYNTVAGYVKEEGLLDRSIVSIRRIQNLDLWEMYCRKKKQLMRIQGVKEIQERRLFHGTDSKNVDSICKYNFDVRLAGQHGHSYGKGVYFAKHASYADKYSKSSIDPFSLYGGLTGSVLRDTKIIFLARVMRILQAVYPLAPLYGGK
ncbi:poly [ADP-ribose] [Lates japonicus]|uniref:Poly [ADP-ribose] polymerase n=1 Tax=Lates japonicus TaxID=270547 RepID=A0AAD3M6W2_LATJO|nr:poly [ADP-ribose] [Lates japonicus]